jgi:hypothetical protein
MISEGSIILFGIYMKKILLLFIFANYLLAIEDANILSFRESVANSYYRFIDYSTSFLYKKNHSNYEYIKKHNKLRFYIDNSIDEDGNINSSFSVRANIKIPKISKKLYLTVDKDSSTISKIETKSQLQEEKQNSRVGLKYYFLRKKEQNIYAKLGGRINLRGDRVYLKFGADKANEFEEITTYIYFHEYYYIKNENFKSEVGFDFRKELNKNFTLSQLNNITLDEDSITYISNTLLLDHYLNKKSMLSYWSTIYTLYDNNSFESKSISFNIKYHYLLREWIFIDFIPSIVKNLTKEKDTKKYFSINFGFVF